MTKQDKVNFIKEWYAFRENKDNMCKKYVSCTECHLYESTDGWPSGENGEYKYVDNCKCDFEDTYAEEIIELM